MIAETKRNPRVLAGELLEKIRALDLTPLDGETGSSANRILMNEGAIKGALEQIKHGTRPLSSWTIPAAKSKASVASGFGGRKKWTPAAS